MKKILSIIVTLSILISSGVLSCFASDYAIKSSNGDTCIDICLDDIDCGYDYKNKESNNYSSVLNVLLIIGGGVLAFKYGPNILGKIVMWGGKKAIESALNTLERVGCKVINFSGLYHFFGGKCTMEQNSVLDKGKNIISSFSSSIYNHIGRMRTDPTASKSSGDAGSNDGTPSGSVSPKDDQVVDYSSDCKRMIGLFTVGGGGFLSGLGRCFFPGKNPKNVFATAVTGAGIIFTAAFGSAFFGLI